MSAAGVVSRVSPVQTALRNCTRDEGGPFEFGNQVLISSHRKPLSSKAMVVNVAETLGHDLSRHGRERRAQANRCRSVESGLVVMCCCTPAWMKQHPLIQQDFSDRVSG